MQEFLKKKGVTKCPPTGSPELRSYHEEQNKQDHFRVKQKAFFRKHAMKKARS